MLNWIKRLFAKRKPKTIWADQTWAEDGYTPALLVYLDTLKVKGKDLIVFDYHDGQNDINPTDIVFVPVKYDTIGRELLYDMYYYNKHTGQIRRHDFEKCDKAFDEFIQKQKAESYLDKV